MMISWCKHHLIWNRPNRRLLGRFRLLSSHLSVRSRRTILHNCRLTKSSKSKKKERKGKTTASTGAFERKVKRRDLKRRHWPTTSNSLFVFRDWIFSFDLFFFRVNWSLMTNPMTDIRVNLFIYSRDSKTQWNKNKKSNDFVSHVGKNIWIRHKTVTDSE